MLDPIVDFLKALGIAAPGRLGWVTVVLTFIIAAIAAWRFMPRMRLFSLQVGWADEPNGRRLNREPLPNAGGLAIFASVIVALVIATILRPIVIEDVQVQVLAILLGGSFMIMAGFIDDQFGLPPVFRLLVQLIAALLIVSAGIRIDIIFGGTAADPGNIWSSVVSVIVTLVWIVGITNAVNLIDGVDGLAGGVSFITAMCLLAVSAQDQAKAAATLLLAALGGAALGFLRHNFPPSRIIMGDSGAYFFGFVLAASSILGNLQIPTVFALFPTVLFLLLPLIDTVQVVLRRLVRRKNPLSSPGKDHLHHGLLARGLSQTRTTLILWGVTLVTNLLAMVILYVTITPEAGKPDTRPHPPVIVATAVGVIIFLGFIVWRRRRALRRAALLVGASAVDTAATTVPEVDLPDDPDGGPLK
ncbi:MAG: undecaprenyl/decaprenyl-phosphate alpha-N-acetylglucosaminyl 1-phosphate transferase [Actinobacteria bacterium]|nr:undecaprenyl/decaprenyl-phosphate alpha-N-acetylglucosaminyl 1-phosphate transferase [Actinomycetota bacterium]